MDFIEFILLFFSATESTVSRAGFDIYQSRRARKRGVDINPTGFGLLEKMLAVFLVQCFLLSLSLHCLDEMFYSLISLLLFC